MAIQSEEKEQGRIVPGRICTRGARTKIFPLTIIMGKEGYEYVLNGEHFQSFSKIWANARQG
jgi:hypothetical protein